MRFNQTKKPVAIFVTKSYLPPYEEYEKYLKEIWKNHTLTNNGPFVQRLEKQLKEYLNVNQLLFLNNGTLALQIAIKALNLTGEIITTPFSYCATTTSILWENLTPVFVDIEDKTFNINADLIEAAITEKTSAILATHVYGNPCEVEKIEKIARKHNLKVIYDGAHAFGVTYKGRAVLDFGDIATCSFHATKVFHTVEGGCVVCHDTDLLYKLDHYRRFGHQNDDYYMMGINAKNSEFHAAMGLTNLPHVAEIIGSRKAASEKYDSLLNWKKLRKPQPDKTDLVYNYAYYPVIFESEDIMKNAIKALNLQEVFPRRYFYPSLNQLPYLNLTNHCPISEDISKRVLSLPLYHEIEDEILEKVSSIINNSI